MGTNGLKTIVVPMVDLKVLREQRNYMLRIRREYGLNNNERDALDGVVNLLDTMLDIAEVGNRKAF